MKFLSTIIAVDDFAPIDGPDLPISTTGAPGGKMGPPICGAGGVPEVTVEQECISPIRITGGMVSNYNRSRRHEMQILLLGRASKRNKSLAERSFDF